MLFMGVIVHNATIGQIINQVAESNGVDATLCEVVAFIESGFNPFADGDNNTSFGLYQLHEGGELGNLTREDAYNPITNANTAIPHIANVAKANPDWNPGQVAAAAQGPADAVAYAAVVNSTYDDVKAGKFPEGWQSGLLRQSGLSIELPDPPVTETEKVESAVNAQTEQLQDQETAAHPNASAIKELTGKIRTHLDELDALL